MILTFLSTTKPIYNTKMYFKFVKGDGSPLWGAEITNKRLKMETIDRHRSTIYIKTYFITSKLFTSSNILCLNAIFDDLARDCEVLESFESLETLDLKF